jgi:hypothetical protein
MTHQTGNVKGEYTALSESVGAPLVNLTTAPADWRPDLLSATFAERLRSLGASLGRAAKVQSRKQWVIAALVNREWADLEQEYRAEQVTREMFLAAASQYLNKCAGWALLSSSGETLRRWADVARQFEGVRGVEQYQELLSFDHFFKARKLYNAGDVTSPLDALEQAHRNGWTAEEMYQALQKEPDGGWGLVELQRRIVALRDADLAWLPEDTAAGVRADLDAALLKLRELHEWIEEQ